MHWPVGTYWSLLNMNKLINKLVRFWLDGYQKWTDLDQSDQSYLIDIYRAKIDTGLSDLQIIAEIKKITPFFF